MEAISMDQVELSGAIEVNHILTLSAKVVANEHAIMQFEAVLDQDKGKKLIGKSLSRKAMQLNCITQEGKQCYFSGQILNANIRSEGGLFFVSAKCVSHSYYFDLIKLSRSFQNIDMSYKDMLKWIEGKDNTGNIVVARSINQRVGYPIIQYAETDWEFAKRMAGNIGTVVFPEIRSGLPQISVGIVDGMEYKLEENAEFSKGVNLEKFRIASQSHPCSINDFVFLKILDYRNFDLGDKVEFQGLRFIVMGKEILIKRGLLEVWYELGTEKGFCVTKHFNKYISGMSIIGIVLSRARENLKIHLNIDDEQDKDTAYQYTWMPQTGNLMYCMPIKGTKVSLYFPSSDEADAIATECIRTNGGKACSEMKSYDMRQLSTEHGKRMRLTPRCVQFVGEKNGVQNTLGLEDTSDVFFESKKSISLISSGSIKFWAAGKVQITAGKKLCVHKTNSSSSIQLSDNEINSHAAKNFLLFSKKGTTKPKDIVFETQSPESSSASQNTESSTSAQKSGESKFPSGIFTGAIMGMIAANSLTPKAADALQSSMLGLATIGVANPGGLALGAVAQNLVALSRLSGLATGAILPKYKVLAAKELLKKLI